MDAAKKEGGSYEEIAVNMASFLRQLMSRILGAQYPVIQEYDLNYIFLYMREGILLN